jgi:hypothetical protein
MFQLTQIAVRAVRLDPVRLPLTAVLLVPGFSDTYVFNLPGAVNLLMGSSGWQRASRVMQPKIWAPMWSDAWLRQFVSVPFAQKPRPFPMEVAPTLRMTEFPPTGASTCEIVHAVDLFSARHPFREYWALPDPWYPRYFRDILVAIETRLLILHVGHYSHDDALQLAQFIVGSGGPATVIVSGGTPEDRWHGRPVPERGAANLDRYFLDLYARIIHNQPLREVARPEDAADALRVDLVLGLDGDNALQLTPLLDRISSLIDNVKTADLRAVETLTRIDLNMLHARDRERLQNRLRTAVLKGAAWREIIIDNVERLDELRRNINWARETGGAMPLSDLSYAVPQLETTLLAFESARERYPELAKELAAEAVKLSSTAPRVLNANFAHPLTREIAVPHRALMAGVDYELLVDVGPRWSRVPSLVTGNDVFPERALPPGDDGYCIHVLFFSDHFLPVESQESKALTAQEPQQSDSGGFPPVEEPPLPEETSFAFEGEFRRPVASGEIWVPAKSGRSFPIIDGRRAEKSGPLALRVRAPNADIDVSAHGRLSLYYENNLLQSAAVSVTVGRGDSYIRKWNKIDVDYVLSGTFADLARYQVRALHKGESCPVGINLAMNDNGSGAHRLMIVGRGDLTVIRPYDPEDAKNVLEIARGKLKECFSLRNDDCVVEEPETARRSALGADNGKSLKQFKCDLFQLAWYGSDIYSHTFGQLSNSRLMRYLSDLAASLESRRVIQISRTTHAQYVYPWAMIYDIPLPNRTIAGKLRWCKVIAEWGSGKDAIRTGPPANKCPYHDAPEHRQDTLCPYGFWGLKHYIEQPINVIPQPKEGETPLPPPDAASTVKLSNPVGCGLGVTRDAQLDAKALEAHLKRIRSLAACTPADGADDWDGVQAMLAQPDVAYFICHGEYDQQNKKSYLSIGPRSDAASHRVYPDQLMQWARTQKDFWANRRPLVFINGCHTTDLAPGEILSFVPTFANFGASAVIGTEISVRLPLAVEVAEKLLERVLNGEKIGVVMHDLRWELANKGNLLGLAYTPYCLSDLTFTR